MSVLLAKPEHEVAYQDVCKLIATHTNLSSLELLAIASNLVGKLVALQDGRTVTADKAMQIVAVNVEAGNKQVLDGAKEMVS